MNNKEFNKIVKNRIEKIKSLISTKSIEYSIDTDRLDHFKQGAKILNTTPEQYCMSLLMKHFKWVLDAVQQPGFFTRNTIDKLDEHVGDIIVYMILLEALFIEGINIEDIRE